MRISSRFDARNWYVRCWWCQGKVSLEGSMGDISGPMHEHGRTCPKRPRGKPPMEEGFRRDPSNRERRDNESLREWLRG